MNPKALFTALLTYLPGFGIMLIYCYYYSYLGDCTAVITVSRVCSVAAGTVVNSAVSLIHFAGRKPAGIIANEHVSGGRFPNGAFPAQQLCWSGADHRALTECASLVCNVLAQACVGLLDSTRASPCSTPGKQWQVCYVVLSGDKVLCGVLAKLVSWPLL